MNLKLTGLRCDMPVGFMAGLGLIRIAPRQVRLGWNPVSHCAELHGIAEEELIERLLCHMTSRYRSPELHIADDVRGIKGSRYQEIVATASTATLQWVRALWREEGEDIIPTNLCFTSGQQRMIQMARQLAEALDPTQSKKAASRSRDKFREALFGPWRYEDNTPSWGWDSASYRMGAQTAQAPAKMPIEGVAAAYWLAWECLPFLPCIPGRGTLGYIKERGTSVWTWTSWAEPLPADAIEALVRRPDEAVALGGRMFEAEIVNSGYYRFFRPGRVRSTR